MHGFDAHGTQGELQTEVAHHGYHEGVVVEFARVFLGTCKNAHDLIAVDHIAFAVYGKATVGVTVECHAQVGSGCLDHGLQLFGVCGSGVLVDVVAVWRSVDHAHVAPARRNASGATTEVAPLAQSATTFKPFNGVGWDLSGPMGAIVDTRWSMYRLVAVAVS